ncbi:hypothetical protein B0T22DRAFT_472639 [Podospora appendiculata]|uniref:Uncharacterized protein n=1 Tax=Podospora appendiculata TaxID=314037 RepID=A0AAE0WZX4_9PEZI|nr:hypothetical protein B0T22DRAFT_472639 [Podospora appendiculata]
MKQHRAVHKTENGSDDDIIIMDRPPPDGLPLSQPTRHVPNRRPFAPSSEARHGDSQALNHDGQNQHHQPRSTMTHAREAQSYYDPVHPQEPHRQDSYSTCRPSRPPVQPVSRDHSGRPPPLHLDAHVQSAHSQATQHHGLGVWTPPTTGRTPSLETLQLPFPTPGQAVARPNSGSLQSPIMTSDGSRQATPQQGHDQQYSASHQSGLQGFQFSQHSRQSSQNILNQNEAYRRRIEALEHDMGQIQQWVVLPISSPVDLDRVSVKGEENEQHIKSMDSRIADTESTVAGLRRTTDDLCALVQHVRQILDLPPVGVNLKPFNLDSMRATLADLVLRTQKIETKYPIDKDEDLPMILPQLVNRVKALEDERKTTDADEPLRREIADLKQRLGDLEAKRSAEHPAPSNIGTINQAKRPLSRPPSLADLEKRRRLDKGEHSRTAISGERRSMATDSEAAPARPRTPELATQPVKKMDDMDIDHESDDLSPPPRSASQPTGSNITAQNPRRSPRTPRATTLLQRQNTGKPTVAENLLPDSPGPELIATDSGKTLFTFLQMMDCTSKKSLSVLAKYLSGNRSYDYPIYTFEHNNTIDSYFLRVGGQVRNALRPGPREDIATLEVQTQLPADQRRVEQMGALQCLLTAKEFDDNDLVPPEYFVCLGEVYKMTEDFNTPTVADQVRSTNFFVLMDIGDPAKGLWQMYRYEQYKERNGAPYYEKIQFRERSNSIGCGKVFDTVCLVEDIKEWKDHCRPMLDDQMFREMVNSGKGRTLLEPMFTVPLWKEMDAVVRKGWGK